MRVVFAARFEGDAVERQPGADHRSEPGEVLREGIARGWIHDLGVGHRREELRLVGEREELAAEAVGLRRDLADRAQGRVGRVDLAEAAECLEHAISHRAPDAGGIEGVLVGPGDRRHRDAGGREGRLELPAQREALKRVVGGADLVEVAAHPAGAKLGVGRADLPVVPGREVGLVGMVVADRREGGHLAPSEWSCASWPASRGGARRGVASSVVNSAAPRQG